MRTTPRETIFQAFETSAESVSITLVLAAFGELEKSINSELRKKWLISSPKTFREAVFLGAAEGFSQPYRTLGKLARFIFYNHPDVVLGLGEVVTFPQPDRADPGECFD